MMQTFAKNISFDRQFCTYWEITTQGTPPAVDYTDDSDFWYNLPANFDISYACSRLYDLTGDPGYLLDHVMAAFHRTSVEDYVFFWDRDKDGIVDRVDADGHRGIASYDENGIDGYSIAADALCLQYRAYLVAARVYTLKGEPGAAAAYTEKAKRLQDIYCREWWNAEEKRFYDFRLKDGSFSERLSFDNAIGALRSGIIQNPEQLEGQLNYMLSLEPRMNVEMRSYVPYLLWQHGRNEDAMRVWLKMTAKDYPRRWYPEISYAAVEALLLGYMGIQPDASTGTVRTRSAAVPGEWAKVCGLPLWDGTITLYHEGPNNSVLGNFTSRPLHWQAQCNGKIDTAIVLPGETARFA